MDLYSLLTIGLAFFAIAISPGPANISNAAIAMSRGRSVSLVYGFGLSSGLVAWGIVAASGLGAVLQTSVYLLMILKVFGGLYLIWLAYLSAKSVVTPEIDQTLNAIQQTSYFSWFMKGFVLNISNPKTVIAWMAALSVGLSESAGVGHLISGVLVCILVGFLTNAFYSLCFSFGCVMNAYKKVARYLNAVFASIYAFAGVSLIRSGFTK